ncbi:MAG: hypothetical protein RIR18_593 [Pseudomonadota bacterium]|jgi:hypothetical protein
MLPLARYRFAFIATSDIRLPEYAGSMLRGAFGHALRGLACMTREKDCTGCPLQTTCPYLAIFAPVPPAEHALQKFSQIPVPYVIEPEHTSWQTIAKGQTLRFDMVLMGKALVELPLVILAWRRALARGVGGSRGTAELGSVEHFNGKFAQAVYLPTQSQITAHAAHTAWPKETNDCPDKVTLHFITPLRLQENGKAIPPNRLTAKTLLMALVRRIHLLMEFHTPQPLTANFADLAQKASLVRDQHSLRWQDWTRYSSRQDQKMTLGGAIGQWTLEGDLSAFLPYLRLGQMLHVGKEAAFGLGHYRLAEHNFSKPAEHREPTGQATDFVEEIV